VSGILPIPAIDIRGGRCVRLRQGDYAQETVYGDDPAEMARRWEADGAQRLHVVDLDGARDGVRANAEPIRRAIQAVSVPVQVGGGVRSIDAAREVLDAGADRVIVGTAAAEQPEQLRHWLEELGAEHVVVGVDSRDGRVATHGWRTEAHLTTLDFCRELAHLSVARVLYTDVSRDGMLEGPNVLMTRQVAQTMKVIASGGIATAEHLKQLAEAGAEAAIIGTALYDGRLSLQDALAAC
jgi:phosphoribosylformimino-5-aminoimidazole carboxamide ribotide isomerase